MCSVFQKKSKAMSLYHRVNSLFCPFLKAPNQKNAYHATVFKRTKWSIVIQNVLKQKRIGFSTVCVVSPACTYVLANYSIFCDRLTNLSKNDAKFLYCKGSYKNWAISWTRFPHHFLLLEFHGLNPKGHCCSQHSSGPWPWAIWLLEEMEKMRLAETW